MKHETVLRILTILDSIAVDHRDRGEIEEAKDIEYVADMIRRETERTS